MKRRIAVLALVAGFIAAPAPGLGVAAMDTCPPCCPQPADSPCQSGEGPCTSVTPVPCCDGAPAAPGSQAQRSIDPPNLQRASLAVRSFPPAARHARLFQVLTSPLRLSVVLLT